MADKLIPPGRREPVVVESLDPTLRLVTYLEDVATKLLNTETAAETNATDIATNTAAIAALPAVVTNVSDLTLTTPSANETLIENKINELLAAMQTAGVMA